MMKVLSTEQADALYRAMCCANDVDARFSFTVDTQDGKVTVKEGENWNVLVVMDEGTILRDYENQAAFATDHGVSI